MSASFFPVFLVLLIAVVRPAAVFLSTLGSKLTVREKTLLAWMRARPLIHPATIGKRDFGLLHAGLAPTWSWSDAVSRARKLERKLGRDDRLLSRRSDPAEPAKVSQARDTLHYLTRVRMCDRAGKRVGFSGHPSEAPTASWPWFKHPERPKRSDRPTLVFGHWAALGLHLGKKEIGLDSGCVWGGPLTAMRLEDETVFQTRKPHQK